MSMFRNFSCSQLVVGIEIKKFLIESRVHMTSIKLVIEDGMENTKKKENVDITLASIYRCMHIHIYIVYTVSYLYTLMNMYV